jgi:hypothetical protein
MAQQTKIVVIWLSQVNWKIMCHELIWIKKKLNFVLIFSFF